MANETKTLDLYQSLSAIIKDDDDLYEKILCFEMLELRELHQYFRDRGVKCSLQDLRNYLEYERITFASKWRENGKKK